MDMHVNNGHTLLEIEAKNRNVKYVKNVDKLISINL